MWFNPLIKTVLRSPLHPILSRNTMLITYSGRKSGRVYSFPVNYLRQGDLITVFTPRRRAWWRNFRRPLPVQLQVRGERLDGSACRVEADPAQFQQVMRAAYPGMRAERLERMAGELEMIRIQLSPERVVLGERERKTLRG